MVQTFTVRGTVSISHPTVRLRRTHLLTENTFPVVPNTGVTSLMATGVHQASLTGPAVHQSSIEMRGGGGGGLYLSYGEVQVGQEPGSRETEDTI